MGAPASGFQVTAKPSCRMLPKAPLPQSLAVLRWTAAGGGLGAGGLSAGVGGVMMLGAPARPAPAPGFAQLCKCVIMPALGHRRAQLEQLLLAGESTWICLASTHLPCPMSPA